MLNRLGSLLYTYFWGRQIGVDLNDNRYYIQHKKHSYKRWVIYNGIVDPSKIPVSWHIWLHSDCETIPRDPPEIQTPAHFSAKHTTKCTTSIANIPSSALECYQSWSPDK